jgi:peptide/nickel transport system substrate-binding protein
MRVAKAFSAGTLRYGAIVAAIGLLLTACGGSSPAQSRPGGQLIFATADQLTTLDPHKNDGVNSQTAANMLLYDRLIHLDAQGKLWPELAASWTVTPSSATFVLKKGPTCSDGTPVTPQVVAASITRMDAPATNSPNTSLSVGTAGYSVTTDNQANSVTVTTDAPFGDLLIGMSMPWASIVCPAGINNPASLATSAAGSGPYTLTSSGAGTYTFTARSDYTWGPHGMTTKDSGVPQTIVMKSGVSDESTAASELLRGEIGFYEFGGIDRARFTGNNNFTILNVPTPGTAYVGIKEQGIFTDKNVRQALFMALDPKALNQATYGGTGIMNTSIVGPQSDCFDAGTSKSQTSYDVAGAKALLDQNGWVVGSDGVRSKNGQRLTVRLIAKSDLAGADDYIIPALQAVGADVQAKTLDQTTWVNLVRNTLQFDMTVHPNGGQMPTPGNAFQYVSGTDTPSGNNWWHIHNSQVDAAVQTATTSSGSARCSSWATAQESLLQDYDVKPFASASNAWISMKSVTLNAMPGQYFDPFTLKD